MLSYGILLGCPAAVEIFNLVTKFRIKGKNINCIDVFFAIWMLLLLFRDVSVGIDLKNYIFIFDMAPSYSFGNILKVWVQGGMEPLYVFLSKIIGIVTRNFRVVIVVVTILSILPLWGLYRYEIKKYGYAAIVLFVNIGLFGIYFSAYRQILAISVTIFAYYFTKKKKPVQFILMVALGFIIHRTAIITLLLYPVFQIKIIKKKWIVPLLFFIGASVVLRKQLFVFFAAFFSDFYNTDITITGAYLVLILLVVLLIMSFLFVDEKRLDETYVGLRNILILCVVLQIFSSLNPIAMRMNYYFLIFVPIVFANLIRVSTGKKKTITKITVFGMCFFFTIFFFYKGLFGSDTLNVFPYVSMFEND